jgi:hypothetical protein
MTDKNKTDPRVVQAAQNLSQAFIAFSLALRDADIAVASPSRKTVTKATIKPVREKTAKAPKAKAQKAKAEGKAEMKPCPVTGVMNTHRRFSYLMPEVRTAANLKKYKGWAKKQPQATEQAAPQQAAEVTA